MSGCECGGRSIQDRMCDLAARPGRRETASEGEFGASAGQESERRSKKAEKSEGSDLETSEKDEEGYEREKRSES